MTQPPTREFDADGDRWRAVEAWRSGGGLGLLYFLPLGDATSEGAGDAAVHEDDRRDRRALLEADESLAELSEEDLAARLAEATPLTETEWRFRAPDERLWLAQSVGPVWADDVASGLTGLRFTSLEGERRRLRVEDDRGAARGRAGLEPCWREAAEAVADAADG